MCLRVERRSSSVHGSHDNPAQEGRDQLEVRPGGMLVQMRVSSGTEHQNLAQVTNIRVKVKRGPACHEVLISPQASFGELKKKLAEPTGLHHEDQKLIYKKRERGSKQYLDVAGVTDGSKIVLVEDVLGRERRCLEMLKKVQREKASKTLEGSSSELDKMSEKVLALKKVASEGGKVESMDVEKLIDALMKLYIKLDSLVVQGDLNLQKRLQVRKTQEHIEMLDALKLKSPLGQSTKPTKTKQAEKKQVKFKGLMPGTHQAPRNSDPVVVTTKWETFE
ncbi:BAG family molecular chaperone regulator 1-like [Rhodamnia argentea]|uniref:BAG family molecular chaperone regulator 1-like n=1 Tax=Rhodamnia argentea TaxID=178133 RepID=A0A8B8NQP2_9MYRT|nr:BAG family molecular chaperone regulator 1-like [Rhodamnia argentea]